MRRPEISHPSGAVALGPDADAAAWLVPVEDGWELDLGHLSTGRDAALEAGNQLVGAAEQAVAAHGGGTLRLWVRGPDDIRSAIAEAAGMILGREVLQMRRALPVGEAWDLHVRPFIVGADEAAWLEVNNRAFAWHPEQGGMTLEDLRAHEAQPWFDADGFLLHTQDGVLLGFCWTKVHSAHEPPLGEIFAIAVDPSAHKRGLGRQLVLAGLDHLHQQGLTIGMLHTESDNEPALRLYRDLGFTVASSDRAYHCEVAAR